MSKSTEEGLMQSFRMVKNGVEELQRALLGDEYGNKGIVGRIQDLESDLNNVGVEVKDVKKQIEGIDRTNFKQKAVAGAVGAGIGAASAIGGKVFWAKLASIFSFIKP